MNMKAGILVGCIMAMVIQGVAGDADRPPTNSLPVAIAQRSLAAERKEIAILASDLANSRTMAKLGVKPFAPSDCDPVLSSNTWKWIALKGIGQRDVEASVTMSRDRTNQTVELRELISVYETLPP
jgi:hypothetical protein